MSGAHQRVAAFALAILFLVVSVGFSIVVIVQMVQNDDSAQVASNENQEEDLLQGTQMENFEPVSDVTELQKIDLKEGTGEVVPEGATVTAHYTGALAKTGVIFQSSHDFGQPIPFSLSEVIPGWTQGVPGMKVGGIRRLLIPANMAYGEAGSPPLIGPNEPLVFDIEIVKIGE